VDFAAFQAIARLSKPRSCARVVGYADERFACSPARVRSMHCCNTPGLRSASKLTASKAHPPIPRAYLIRNDEGAPKSRGMPGLCSSRATRSASPWNRPGLHPMPERKLVRARELRSGSGIVRPCAFLGLEVDHRHRHHFDFGEEQGTLATHGTGSDDILLLPRKGSYTATLATLSLSTISDWRLGAR
jgi:hypothetical protein